MSWISGLRSPRVLAVIAGGAVLAAVATGVAAAATPSTGFGACANSSHRLALQNSSGHCPRHFSKVKIGARGPAGPSGVVSMTHYAPGGATPITGTVYTFLGSPPQLSFANTHTAAEVTGTVDEAPAVTGSITDVLGICSEPAGGSKLTPFAQVAPEFNATANSFFAQTVSGVVGNLAHGKYLVGLCARDQGNVINGAASVTIVLAQTASGVHLDMAKPAAAAQKNN